jgi:hypothetical protein
MSDLLLADGLLATLQIACQIDTAIAGSQYSIQPLQD